MSSCSRSRLGRLFAAAVGVAALLAAAPTPVATDGQSRFSIGVLRRDGILIPFAAYERGHWSAPWPAQPRGLPLPISIDSVPRKWWGPQDPSAPWRAALPGGNVALTLRTPIQFPVFCQKRIGLTTDYRGADWEIGAPTIPKDGMAIAGNTEVLPIEQVDPASADGDRLSAGMTADFNKQETAASHAFIHWKHPVPDADRRKLPITIETYYRSTQERNGTRWTASYVEAVRSYPPGPGDESCGLVTYVSGWVLEVAGRKPRYFLQGRVTYCDRAGISFIQPLGRLHLGSEWYWVMQFSRWNGELYLVSRLMPDEVTPEVTFDGGSCAR